MGQFAAADGARKAYRLLLRVDALALSELDSVFLSQSIQTRSEVLGAIRVGRASRGRGRRHSRPTLERPYPRKTGSSAQSTGDSYSRWVSWLVRLHAPRALCARSGYNRGLPQPCVLLRGVDRCTHMGGSNGHCTGVFRDCERVHELRLWHGRDYLSCSFRRDHRHDRTLGSPFRRLSLPLASRSSACFHNAARPTIYRGYRGGGARPGGGPIENRMKERNNACSSRRGWRKL